MEILNHFFNHTDILKAGLALVAGLALGYEREVKDKSAGIKTISIITLGATLFAILSQNYSGSGDNFAIAAGIISGIGFLGAGVIFKEGFTIYGLTTAGIIWVAAAIGMAIGFGEFYLAGLFFVSVLLITTAVKLWGKKLMPKFSSKILVLLYPYEQTETRSEIERQLRELAEHFFLTKIEKTDDSSIRLTFDIHISEDKILALEEQLLKNKTLTSFSL